MCPARAVGPAGGMCEKERTTFFPSRGSFLFFQACSCSPPSATSQLSRDGVAPRVYKSTSTTQRGEARSRLGARDCWCKVALRAGAPRERSGHRAAARVDLATPCRDRSPRERRALRHGSGLGERDVCGRRAACAQRGAHCFARGQLAHLWSLDASVRGCQSWRGQIISDGSARFEAFVGSRGGAAGAVPKFVRHGARCGGA